MDLAEIVRIDVLDDLNDLDESSPQFPDQLADLLSGRLYKGWISGLRDNDVSWLVEYLDKVRPHLVIYPLSAQLA